MTQQWNDERLREVLREQAGRSVGTESGRTDADLEDVIMRRVAATPQVGSVQRRIRTSVGLGLWRRAWVAGTLGALVVASFVMVPNYCGHSSQGLSPKELADLDADIESHWADLTADNTKLYGDLDLE